MSMHWGSRREQH